MSSSRSGGFGSDRGRSFGSGGGSFGGDRGRFGERRFGDSRSGGFGDRGGGGPMRGKSNPGENLRRVKWDQYTLVPFEKVWLKLY